MEALVARISYLECTKCGEHVSADTPQTICPKDGGSFYVAYHLPPLVGKLKKESFAGRVATLWSYAAGLRDVPPVTLGEGFTPMLPSRQYPGIWIKDEGLNPTGSFKARGLCAAVTMCKWYGIKKIAVPSAGNAASALAAYAAAAGLESYIFMPKDVPMTNRVECDYFGAQVTLVDGLISDCAKKVAEL